MSDFIESQEAAGSGASCLAWNVGPYQLPQLCQLCHLRQPPLPLPDRILGIELFALAKAVILIHRQILELGKSRSEFSVIAGVFTFRVRRRNLSKCDRLLR